MGSGLRATESEGSKRLARWEFPDAPAMRPDNECAARGLEDARDECVREAKADFCPLCRSVFC